MRVTISFAIKNYVEVMESWALREGNVTFFLELEGRVLKSVCLSFSGVSVHAAPSIKKPKSPDVPLEIGLNTDEYAALARKRLMAWQAVASGVQVFDIDYDSYEMRFHAESFDEEAQIVLKSYSFNYDQSLNSSCDFEQLGRAFCFGMVPDDRIESTSHFREGRLAFEAGRYVDAYNNFFLFLETRYCDGKSKTAQQISLLKDVAEFRESLNAVSKDYDFGAKDERFELFSSDADFKDKVRALVLNRGKLRHHSLKSPNRWDPNQQGQHKAEARFLMAVVHGIVIKESLGDIYSQDALVEFRDQSVSSGNETNIEVVTRRLNPESELSLKISCPTTKATSRLCLVAVRSAIQECEKNGQLSDTVEFRCLYNQRNLELFALSFDTWAYSKSREIKSDKPIYNIGCTFECLHSKILNSHTFTIPYGLPVIKISDVWHILQLCFDHIEERDPSSRIMALKLFIGNAKRPIVSYRVGSLVDC